MSRERLIWIGLAAVLMLALIVAAVNGAQQNAWMEGYTFGRLAAGEAAWDALATTLAAHGPAAPPLVCFGAGW